MGDGKRKASGSELAQDWNFRFFDNHSFLSHLRTDNIIVLEVTAILVTLKIITTTASAGKVMQPVVSVLPFVCLFILNL